MEYRNSKTVIEAKRRSLEGSQVLGGGKMVEEQPKSQQLSNFNIDELEMDDLLADFEQSEANRIKNSLPQILKTVKMPDLEELVSEREPDFHGLDEIFGSLTKKRIDYFAKWMDLILLEEHEDFER